MPQHRFLRLLAARRMPWLRGAAALIFTLTALSSCRSPLGVDNVGADRVRTQLEASVLTGDEPTASTRQTVAMLGLAETWEDDPDAALDQLRALALQERDRPLWFALAELHFVRARDTGERGEYLASAVCAWWYLTSTQMDNPADPFDRRFRLACDIYNRSLVRALRSDDSEGDSIRFKPGTFTLPGGSIDIHLDRSHFPWDPKLITRIVAADDLEVRGFEVRIRDFGLGAPFVGVGENKDPSTPETKYLPPRLSVSGTAFLRIDDRPESWSDGSLTASLELYGDDEVPSVDINGRRVPLESDLTASLAYSLETARAWDLELSGFMGEALNFKAGMFMLRPYVPGKIPVVLVHGTASSPARWAPMFNGLLADPVVRSRCQFWFFTYSTGNPVAYSGDLLRESLRDIVHTLDPQGLDPALRQIVLMGHSQGGLLTRMAATNTGNAIWNGLTKEPIANFDLDPEARALIERTLFWERVPEVTRVIFLATPHRGAFLTTGWIGSFAASLVSIPKQLGGTISDFVTRNKEKFPPELRDKIPTAVDNMKPDNPFLVALGSIPIDPAVRSHSIIAIEEDVLPPEGDDGVVLYTSAHLDDSDSEFVVHSDHSCQANPLVIREVRRILRLQVSSFDEQRAAAGLPPVGIKP